MTVIEFAPESEQASRYRELAGAVMDNTTFIIPSFLEMEDLESYNFV